MLNPKVALRAQTQRGCQGFTLLELLITVAIVAILVTIAAPNFVSFVSESRLDTLQNRFVSSLSLARSEAIRRGTDITVCPRGSSDTSCGSSWANGWVVLDGSTTLRVEEALGGSVALTLSSGSSVVFSSTGAISSSDVQCAAFDDGDATTDARNIQISLFGRIKQWDYSGICQYQAATE